MSIITGTRIVTSNVHLCDHLRSLPVLMGILCLAAGCYKHCLNPTSRVPFMCDTITARSSTINGEQELGQSTRTWIMHETSRGQALPKVEAKGAQEENLGCLIKHVAHNPQTGKEHPARSAGYEECTGKWDAGSSPLLPVPPVSASVALSTRYFQEWHHRLGSLVISHP